MTNDTLTAEQIETFDDIQADQPSEQAQANAANLLASCSYTSTALAALAAVLRDDCCDADADVLLALAERMARYEATIV